MSEWAFVAINLAAGLFWLATLIVKAIGAAGSPAHAGAPAAAGNPANR